MNRSSDRFARCRGIKVYNRIKHQAALTLALRALRQPEGIVTGVKSLGRVLVRGRYHCPLLITGHPRCGTTSAASLCKSLGLDVGSEQVEVDGISSWMMAVDDHCNPYGGGPTRSRLDLRWNFLILVVRDLVTAVPSVMLENRHARLSYDFRRSHIKNRLGIDLDNEPDDMAKALRSIISWVRIVIEQKPNFYFRIEDQQTDFCKYLSTMMPAESIRGNSPLPVWENADKLYDGIRPKKPALTSKEWTTISQHLKTEVEWYSNLFGYTNPSTINSL